PGGWWGRRERGARPGGGAGAGAGGGATTGGAPTRGTDTGAACRTLAGGAGAGRRAGPDGWGAPPQGEVAAAAALTTLRESLLQPPGEPTGWSTRVYSAFEAASAAVSALGGPCTTLSVVLLEDGAARPFHAGDSPILVFGQRGRRKLEVVAHSPTAYAVEAGFLVEEEAMLHEDRHVVLNALGAEGARIDIGAPVRLNPRDTVVVASDGLSDNLYSEEIVGLLRAGPVGAGLASAAALCAERMAQEGGDRLGHADDLTVLAFRAAITSERS
nr:protein phosphatase 2C domain-containing protein [Planctomycetota bacterium]